MDERVNAVQKMQEYIDEHYFETITMAELSNVSLYSPWHSYRLFSIYTGYTPSDYIRKVRLSKSAIKLKSGNYHVIDAAGDCGFLSVDGYQRAFKNEFGCNPYVYSKHPVPIGLFITYGVKYKQLRKDVLTMDNLQNVFITKIHKSLRKVIIKRGTKAKDYFPYCEEVGCDVWGMLESIDSISGEPVCLWLPDSYVLPNTSVYVQGVEVEMGYSGIIPNGFDVITLPECDYLMFQGEPFNEENYCEAIVALQKAIEKYDPKIIGYTFDSSNPRIQLEPKGERGYIELCPVVKIN